MPEFNLIRPLFILRALAIILIKDFAQYYYINRNIGNIIYKIVIKNKRF